MSVGKIFKMLGTVVGCVIVIAFLLNLILPNVMITVTNAVEGMIYNATGLSLDFNGDGKLGAANSGKDQQAGVNNSGEEEAGKVKGFNGGGGNTNP